MVWAEHKLWDDTLTGDARRTPHRRCHSLGCIGETDVKLKQFSPSVTPSATYPTRTAADSS